ncbi:MAG: hypothetical protein ACHQFX_18655 [Chitinophagales bacterium]
MFVPTWNKYLPVLKIIMKRSVNSEQTLTMNASDFQRAAGGRKIKFGFSIVLHKGRLHTVDNPPAIAREFVTVLQQDQTINPLIRQYDFEFSLNNSFQLVIKNITVPAVETATSNSGESNKEE